MIVIWLYGAFLFFILCTYTTVGGLSIGRNHAGGRSRRSSNNDTNLDSTFTNVQSHKMPIEILEPDLARRIFVGANNPLRRTTVRNLQRVTLRPNVRLRRAAELPPSKLKALQLSTVKAGVSKRSIEAAPENNFKLAQNDDTLDVAVDYISTEEIDSNPNITHPNEVIDKPISSDKGENTSQVVIPQSIKQEIATIAITTDSSTASFSKSTQVMPTTDEESTSTSAKEMSAVGNVDFRTMLRSSVALHEFADDSTRPTTVANSTHKTEGVEDTVSAMEEDSSELQTAEPSLEVMTKVAIPIRIAILSDGHVTPPSLPSPPPPPTTTTATDLKVTEVIGGSMKQQTSPDVLIPLSSNQPTGDPQKALLHQTDEEGKFVLRTLPEQHILVIGNEVRTMDPVETPPGSGFFTFRHHNKRRRVKIQAKYLLNDQFFGTDPLKTNRTIKSGSTSSSNSYQIENDFARTKRDTAKPLRTTFGMQFGRLRREASRYLNKQIEVTGESPNDSLSSSVSSNTFPSSTPKRSKTSPTNATSQVGNKKTVRQLVERDDVRPAYIPRLVAVTKTPKPPTAKTLINRPKYVGSEQYKRQPTRIMPQIKHKKLHNVVARDEPLFDGNDLVGDLSTLLTGATFAPPNQVDNVQSPLSVQEMRQPVIFENQSPSLNPSSTNFGSAIFAQDRAIVSQNFDPQTVPITQNLAIQSSSIPQGLTPQFVQQEQVFPQDQLYFIETSGTDLNPQPQLFLLRPIPSDASLQQPMHSSPEVAQFPPPFSQGQMSSVTSNPETQLRPQSLEPFPTLSPQAQHTSTSAPQTPTVSFRIRERTEVYSPETQQPQTTTEPFYTTEAIAARIFAHVDSESPNMSNSTDADTLIGANANENDRERSITMNEEGSAFTQEIDSPHLKTRSINQRKPTSGQNSNINEGNGNEEENTSDTERRAAEMENETPNRRRVVKVVRKGAIRSSAINRSSFATNPTMIRNASQTSTSTAIEQRLRNARKEQINATISLNSMASMAVTDSSRVSTNGKGSMNTKRGP